MFKRKFKKLTDEKLAAIIYAGIATHEEKELYRQLKARKARESQALWSSMHNWKDIKE
jgi:hypothetical protein